MAPGAARGFRAGVVGAIAQGWLREADPNGRINPRRWTNAAACLEGVDILFLSQNDTPDAEKRSRELLQHVPIVAFTRGGRGVTLLTRNGEERFSTQPRPEVDPTGAGDVFAAAFLVSYVERHDLPEAAAFASCAASFVVRGRGRRDARRPRRGGAPHAGAARVHRGRRHHAAARPRTLVIDGLAPRPRPIRRFPLSPFPRRLRLSSTDWLSVLVQSVDFS